MSYNLQYQTNLIPKELFGTGSAGGSEVSMNISPTGIILEGDLNTPNPITATISQAGIITDNPTGFNILSSLNMNNNNITNLNTITPDISTNKINITSPNGVYFNTTTNNTGDGVIYGSAHQIEIVDSTEATGVFYPLFSNGSGTNKDVRLDTNLIYTPSTDTLSCSNFTGLASQATAITIEETLETDSTFYPTFVNSGGTDKTVRIDNGLTYNPLSNTLTTATFSGNATSSTTAITATNADNAYIQTTLDNITHYLHFSASGTDGYAVINKNQNTLSCNPITSTITATTFNGTSTNSNNVLITSDGSTTTACYIPYVKVIGTGNKPLFIDDTAPTFTFTPNTGTVSCTASRANTFLSGTGSDLTITNTTLGNKIVFNTSSGPTVQCCQMDSTGLVMASGKIISGLIDTGGLVFLSTGSFAITGSASNTSFNLSSIFNSTYKNYRIVIYPTTQLSFNAYPSYALQAFLGTGAPVPTIASLYGFEISSFASTIVSPVYTASASIASTPLIFAVSQSINHQTVIEIENVGYSATATQAIGIKCKSFYGNPGVNGASDRSIIASYSTGTAITGLTIQQGAISTGNNMTIGWTVYGYK